MEVIDRIRNCKDDEQLYFLTKKLIKEAMAEVKHVNKCYGLIGTKSELNRKEVDFDINKTQRYSFTVPHWCGYIPLKTKVVYGIAMGKKINYDCNCGCYYYVDDDSYVYDFIKQIKDYDVEDCFDVISIINGFSRNLFENIFFPIERTKIHTALFESDYRYLEPVKEHSIKDFYGTGSARCTEYALIANNLLSVLKIPAYYCMDKEHAFNIFFTKKDDNKNEYEGYVLDFSEAVRVYNLQFRYVGLYPFMEKIATSENKYIILPNGDIHIIDVPKTLEEEEKESRFYEELMNGERRVQFDDTFIIIINGHLYKVPKDNKRDYGIDITPEKDNKKLILSRK